VDLNALLHTEKFNELHPVLYRRVNLLATKHQVSGRELSETEFVQLFIVEAIDVNSNEDLIMIFEILDQGHTGMISARDLVSFLRLRN
jgi:Ca2+-binding EF-hand superfamily protein